MFLLLAAFDMTSLVPLAVFGLFTIGAWWFMERLSSDGSRYEQRLDELREPQAAARRRRQTARSDSMAKMLEKATPTFAKPLQPKNEQEMSKLKLRLNHAGFRSETATSIFLGLKLIGLIAGFLLGGGALIITKGMNYNTAMYAVAIGGVCFYLPEIILRFISSSRREAIFLGLPDALDLMVVCVEAGLGLDQAMRKVAEEMKSSYRVIAEEFALCNFQLQMGRERAEVLHELGYRTGVDDVRALAAILVQADKFGSSIAQALRVQSDSMRTRRRQLAEERAAKTAVKLIFPLVLFIFPAIFVVLVGPAAITMMNELFPKMAGNG